MVVSTYVRNFENFLQTSRNYIKTSAYDSFEGDSTTLFEALMILLTISLPLTPLNSLSFPSTFTTLGLTMHYVMH